MIVTGSRKHLVAATQHVLPHYLRRNVRVTGLGEVAIGGASNEAAFSLWIEPACCFAVRYYWSEWRALCLLATRTALLLLLLLSTTTAATLSAASTLIASAPAVVTVIAIAVSTTTSAASASLFALLLSLPTPISSISLSAGTLRAAGLRIVL
jgi:hypothetical protein